MSRLVTLEFSHQAFSFSAGHFTIFSATERERLHGHNYYVGATLAARIIESGITFNYLIFKKRLLKLCEQLDRNFLIAQHSPYLRITSQSDYYEVIFGEDKMTFLKKDALLLPVTNTTLEELSRWFVEQLIADTAFIQDHHIEQLTIKVFNGPEQSAAFGWQI